MAGAANSWFWPSRAIDRWQQLSVQLYREFAHSLRERANLMRQADGMRVGGAQERHIHLRGLIRKHKNQRADCHPSARQWPMGERLERLWDRQEQLWSELIAPATATCCACRRCPVGKGRWPH